MMVRQKVVPFEERMRERRRAEMAAGTDSHLAATDASSSVPVPPVPTANGLVRAHRDTFHTAMTERQQKLAPERPPSKAGAPAAAGRKDGAGGPVLPAQKRSRRGLRRVVLDVLVSRGTLVVLTAAGASGGVAMFMARSAAQQVASAAAGRGAVASATAGGVPAVVKGKAAVPVSSKA